jgi:site-specific recombinase XerD
VCGVIVRAAVRAELDATVHGPRILRHTAASRMVRHGARIKDVADVLRHRSPDTTAIYTKVDLPDLAAVAMPWPQKGEL